MLKLAKYVRNCVVFWENLHSWQKFYTTADRDSRDKFQVCLRGGRWSWEVGGDLGKIGVRGDSAGHWADGTTAWKMLFTASFFVAKSTFDCLKNVPSRFRDIWQCDIFTEGANSGRALRDYLMMIWHNFTSPAVRDFFSDIVTGTLLLNYTPVLENSSSVKLK